MHLIFDFDGTLVDSYHKVVEKFNVLADEFNFRKIHPDEIEGLRDLNSKALLKHLRIPFYKIPRVIYAARKQIRHDIVTLAPFPIMSDVLQQFYDAGFNLGILTSNSQQNVETWLKHYKLYHFFDFIHIESSYFGKKRVLKKILKTYHIDKSKAFYIGDETRDIEAAKKAKIYSIAVTWGFNSEKTLQASQPHYIVRTPNDMLSIFDLTEFR